MQILNDEGTNVTSSVSWQVFDNGVWYKEQRSGWGRMGQRTTITLAPGETWTFKINYTSPNNGRHNVRMTLNSEPSEHWAYTNFADTIHWGTGTWTIDGDAPSGTTFRIYKICVGEVSGTGYGYQTNYPTGGWKVATNGIGYCTVWTYEINVVRTGQEKPQIIDDGTGTISGDTKTMTFTGEPATISFSPDFGSGTLSWSAVPANIEVKSRSNHGNEQYKDKDIPPLVLQTTVAGTYTITLTSNTGRWADGSKIGRAHV